MNTKAKQFKSKVLNWLSSEGFKINKKVKVYNTKRYGLEVRIYDEPMEMQNTKKSRRMIKNPTDEYNCTYGIHSRKISTYIHINENDFKNENEKRFIIAMLKQ